MPLTIIAEHLAALEASHLLHRSLHRLRFLPFVLFRRSEEMRTSFSAMLRIVSRDRYLLVRNLHRPELFGPFGGVYKHYDTAARTLDGLDFRPHVLGPGSDMEGDIRGFLPRKNIARLVRWFERGEERETHSDCLRRELSEELREAKLLSQHPIPAQPSFRRVRRVTEAPNRVPGEHYHQYRVFEVYEMNGRGRSVARFLENLCQRGRSHEYLRLATASEIVKGRLHDGSAIGHHAGYLLGHRQVRPDAPMFTDAGPH